MPAEVEAPEAPPGLQHKSATIEPIVTTDDRTGEVTAVVSVTNVVDDVGDVILPGAYTTTLTKRRPKGVWSHSWKDWVARTEDIREYAPGDPELKALLDAADKTLPAEAGALVVRCKFNMRDPDSVKAYEKVKFFSETNECQWSIGYSVPPGKGVRDTKGVRKIHSLDLFEYSPVLFGAASQSTSLSVKSLDPAQWPDENKGVVPEDENPPAGLEPVDDQVAGDGVVPEDQILGDDEPLPDLTTPIADDVLDDAEGVAREAVGDGAPETAPVMPVDEPTEVKRKFGADEREQAAGKGQALDDGSFPIKNEADLRNAIKAVGRAKDPAAAKRHIIKRARALGLTNLLPDGWNETKGAVSTEDTLAEFEARIAAVEAKYNTGPVGDAGGRQNWVDKAGGLPPFIRAVAHALIRSGKSKAQAIQIAVGTIRRWAAGGGDVTAETRAKAQATIAEWEAMKGGKDAAPEVVETPAEPEPAEAASGEPAGLLTKWNPTAEVGPLAAHLPSTETLTGTRFLVEAKDVPHIAGTQEEHREMLRIALSDLLTADVPDADRSRYWVGIDGTWDDEVVATVYGGDDESTWRVPYTLDTDSAGNGAAVLGAPVPTRLTLAVDQDTTDTDLGLPTVLVDGIDAVMVGVKLLAATPEVKAGRVLSGSNASRIATAVESLISVLQSAGVQITIPETAPMPAAEEEKSVEDTDFPGVDDLLAEAAQLRVLALRA